MSNGQDVEETPIEFCNGIVIFEDDRGDGNTITVFATCKRLLGHDDQEHILEILDEKGNIISNITWIRNNDQT